MKRLSALAVILVSAACSTSNETASKSPDGGTEGTGQGGDGTGVGGDGTGPGGTTVVKTGTVSLSQTKMTIAGKDYDSYSASAIFIEGTSAATSGTTGTGCTQSTEGDCAITACDSSGAVVQDAGAAIPAEAGAPQKPSTAGDITVKALKEISLKPGANGSYTPLSEQVPLWAADGDVSVKAAGAEVPAFEKVLKGPGAVKLSAPAWPAAGTPLTIDRAQDLEFTWTNGGAGSLSASLTSTAAGKTTLMTCKFAASAGTGKIAKAALGKLVVTDTGTISLTSTNTEIVEAGGWKITITAGSIATNSAGTLASGLAKNQVSA